MHKKAQTSLLDFLRDVIPELKDFNLIVKPNPVADPKARALYSMWLDIENKVADRKYIRPTDMTQAQISELESSGLIQIQGKYLKVTAKGADAIKSLILHSENSSFNKSAFSMIRTAQSEESAPQHSNWYSQQKLIENRYSQEKVNLENQYEDTPDDIQD